MNCPRCGTEHAEGQRFCGNCGKQLEAGSLDAAALETIDVRIRSVLDEHFKDQKVVEIELAQAVATRLTEWSKLVGFVVAVPLALLIATLAIWGITSFLDFQKKVDAGKAQVAQSINKANQDVGLAIGTAKDAVNKTAHDAQEVQAQLDSVRQQLGSLPEDVQTLKAKVNRLEEKIGFAPTPSLTPQLQRKLSGVLTQFQHYCQAVGFHPRPGEVKVRIEKALSPGTAAYYDPGTQEMIVDAASADDPSIVLREYMHRTLYTATAPAGADWIAIENGLASYYPASFLNNSRTPYWNMTDLETMPKDHATNFTWGNVGWGGAFWELRSLMGKDACDRFLLTFWASLDPGYKGDYPAYALAKLLQAYGAAGARNEGAVRAILARRGIR